MRQSLLFARTRRSETKQEPGGVSAQLLSKAGFVDRLMAGVYTFLPLGNLVLNKIENIIREEMLAIGSQEVLLPALHPVANWEATGRLSGFDALLKAQSRYADRVFALGPSHEEVITPLVKSFLQSYKDLSISLFQIQTKCGIGSAVEEGNSTGAQVGREAERLYNQLTAAGIEVLYDDRKNLSAGIRFNDCDLIGIPIRVIVSEKSLASHSAEITMRNNSAEPQLISIDHLCEHLRSFLASLK